MRNLVLQALAAGGYAPDSPVAVHALDRARDVGMAVKGIPDYRYYYGMRRMPDIDPQITAVNLVLDAAAETARGVRRITMRKP